MHSLPVASGRLGSVDWWLRPVDGSLGLVDGSLGLPDGSRSRRAVARSAGATGRRVGLRTVARSAGRAMGQPWCFIART